MVDQTWRIWYGMTGAFPSGVWKRATGIIG